MTARSSAVSGPGLRMIALGIVDLADVVQEGGELGLVARVLVEAEPVAHVQHEATTSRLWSPV